MKLAAIIDNVDSLNSGVTSAPDPSIILSSILVIANRIFGYILPVAVFLVLAYGIYGGILYATAYGSEEKATKAKNTILWAVIGAVVIGFAFVLVRFFAITLLGGDASTVNKYLPQ